MNLTESVTLVRYEDLLVDTLKELKKIYEFLDISIEEQQIRDITKRHSFENINTNSKGRGKFARSAKPGKWKENFNDTEKEMMKKIMGKTLSKLGYNQ